MWDTGEEVGLDNERVGLSDTKPVVDSDMKPPIDLSHSTLTPDQKVRVENLLFEYRDIFSTPERPYGRTNLVQHYIDTGGNKPLKT